MNTGISIRPLQTLEALREAVALQQAILSEHDPAIWQLPQLAQIEQSGGLLLGAYSAPPPAGVLEGVLIDLLAVTDGYSACQTVVWGVAADCRDRGIGTKLREIERRTLQREAIDIVFWNPDPLCSSELHVALNKLGAILTSYSSDSLGSTLDSRAMGLSTDRVRCEWWIDAPRVIDVLDRGSSPHHQHIGLHEMNVLTKTTTLPSGVRGILECDTHPASNHVLAEIPESIRQVQVHDRNAAIQWRLMIRDLFELLFDRGYLGVGLVHEGGRSFVLFKKGTRRTELASVEN